MITPEKSIEIAKALQSLGWATVRYGQRIEKALNDPTLKNIEMKSKWGKMMTERAKSLDKMLVEAIDLLKPKSRFFRTGSVPEGYEGNVDVFLDFKDGSIPHLGRNYQGCVWQGEPNVKSWRPAVD